MNRYTWGLLTMAALGFGSGNVGAADVMADQAAQPTLGKSLAKDTVKGTLMRRDGEFYWIKDRDDNEIKLHVDTNTKVDKLVTGDQVKADVTESGQTTTLQRDE